MLLEMAENNDSALADLGITEIGRILIVEKLKLI